MSDIIKIVVKSVVMSTETKGLKLVTAQIGTDPEKVYKFSELKQDGTPRKGYTDIKDGEFTCYINGEYIASAYPVQQQGGGFKGGFQKQAYKQDPQTQREIIRQSCLNYSVNLVNVYAAGKFDMTIEARAKMTVDTAKILESWVREGHVNDTDNK